MKLNSKARFSFAFQGFLSAQGHDMCDLSPQTRDWTHAPCIASADY